MQTNTFLCMCHALFGYGLNIILGIEEEIPKPQNLASAAVTFLSFTVVSCNYAFADIGIIGDYTLRLE
mgnify:CR=1 FL=1